MHGTTRGSICNYAVSFLGGGVRSCSNQIIENITGTFDITDPFVATDQLIATKTGVWDYSVAITETASG